MLSDTNKEREDIPPYNEEEKLEEFFNSSPGSSFVKRVLKLNDLHLAAYIRDLVSEDVLSNSNIIQDLREAKNPLFICISIFSDIILVCDKSGNLEFLRSEKNRILNNKELERQAKYCNDFRPSQWPEGKLTDDLFSVVRSGVRIPRQTEQPDNNDPPPEIVMDEVEDILSGLLADGYSMDEIVVALRQEIDNR